jgi:hypothetical protein
VLTIMDIWKKGFSKRNIDETKKIESNEEVII